MKRLLLASLLSLLASASAHASQCPTMWRAVDATLMSKQVDATTRAKVEKLRAEGEALHKSGRHAESEAALAQALKLLGAN